MKFNWTLLFFLIFFTSCFKEQKKNSYAYISKEKFVDSLNIGIKGKTKVEIENFRNDNREDNLIILNFYKQDIIGNKWRQAGRFYFDKDGITGIDAEISDFNNDGFNDFTYRSGIAGRGGNEIRKLFIYDQKNRRFIYIKNSDNYPNLSFNSELNCINSLILTGSTTTVFLRIQKDSLDEFAKIDVSDSIIVREKDSSGKFRIIEKKITGNDDDFYSGYFNYKPLLR